MSVELLVNLVLQAFGVGLAIFFSYLSFQKRRIQLGEEPTLPQYFTRRNNYRFGLIFYCLLMAALYWLLTAEWLPLQPLVSLTVGHLRAGAFVDLLNKLDGHILLSLIAAGAFLFFLAWESKFNPLLTFRDSIHDAFAIPTKAVEVYNALITSRLSAVDEKLKTQIAERLIVSTIDPGDFDKSDDSVEYKWAHNCLLFEQIQHYAQQPSFRRFFNEPSLKWGEICISHNATSEKVLLWKEKEPHYTKTINLIDGLDRLTGLLCRMLACLIVFGSASENEMWASVRQLGGNVHEVRLKHTYKYVLIFTAATAVGVMLGREISVWLHNVFLFPEQPLAHFNYATLRWIGYGLLIYVLPIALVFIARTLAFKRQRNQSDLNYGFYMAMMIMGFVVSTGMSALILELTFFRRDSFNFLESFLNFMRWGILPALMCGYVAYRMDKPVSESESLGKFLAQSALRFVGWGVVAVVIMLYASDDFPLKETNLRFVLVGTAFFVLGSLGACVRFKTISAGSDSH